MSLISVCSWSVDYSLSGSHCLADGPVLHALLSSSFLQYQKKDLLPTTEHCYILGFFFMTGLHPVYFRLSNATAEEPPWSREAMYAIKEVGIRFWKKEII